MPEFGRYFRSPYADEEEGLSLRRRPPAGSFDERDPALVRALPTKAEVKEEVEIQKQDEERNPFFNALATISQLSGAEMVKSFLAGLPEGLGMAFDRAEKSTPADFFRDFFREKNEGVETPFAEVRKAWGGGDIQGVGAFLIDFLGEVAFDPLTYLTFGGAAIPKAFKSLVPAAKGLSRTQRAEKGLWSAVALHVPFTHMTAPLLPRFGLKALDSNVAKAWDSIGYRFASLPGIAGMTRAVTRNPILPGEKAGPVRDALRELEATRVKVQQGFLENLMGLPEEVRDLILKDPQTGRILADFSELGISLFDDKVAIGNAYRDIPTQIKNIRLQRRMAEDPEFAHAWATLNNPAAFVSWKKRASELPESLVGRGADEILSSRSDEWLEAARYVYQKHPDIPMDAIWLREGGFKPRAGVDFESETLADYYRQVNADLKARGMPPLPESQGLEPLRQQSEDLLVSAGKSSKGIKEQIRQSRIDDFEAFWARLNNGDLKDPKFRAGLEDWLSLHKTQMDNLRDAEVASGLLNGTVENYFPRIQSPQAKEWINQKLQSAFLKATNNDSLTASFLEKRKFTDMLTTEVNAFLRHVGSKVTDYKALGTTAEKMAEDSARYGPTQAMLKAVFPAKALKALRKITGQTDPDLVDWFSTNPIYSDYLRTRGSALLQGTKKAWDVFLDPESPNVHDTAEMADVPSVLSLIKRAQESGGDSVLVMRAPKSIDLEDEGSVLRLLADTEVRSRANLYRGALRDDLKRAISESETGYQGVIKNLQAALRDGRNYAVFPIGHPEAGSQPLAAVQLRHILDQEDEASGALDFLRRVRGRLEDAEMRKVIEKDESYLVHGGDVVGEAGLPLPTGPVRTGDALTDTAVEFWRRAKDAALGREKDAAFWTEGIQKNLDDLKKLRVSWAEEISWDKLRDEAPDVLESLTRGEDLDRARTITSYFDDEIARLEGRIEALKGGKTPKTLDLALEIARSEIHAKMAHAASLRQSRLGLKALMADDILRLRGMRGRISDAFKETGQKREAMFADMLKNGVSEEMVDNHAAMLYDWADRGILAIDELPETMKQRLKEGRLKGQIHLVDAQAYGEAHRLITDLRKPDPLRANPFVNVLDAIRHWWIPRTVGNVAYLNTRIRDGIQGHMTLANAGLWTLGGMVDSFKVRRAIGKASQTGRPLADFLGEGTMDVVENGVKVKKTLAEVVQTAQREGVVGFGLLRDTIASAPMDAIKMMGAPDKGISGVVQGALGLVGLSKASRDPLLRAGMRVSNYLDDEVRLQGYLSGIRKGMSMKDAAEATKRWTYGFHGPTTSFERHYALRAVPFYRFSRWAVGTTGELFMRQPAVIAMHEKLRSVSYQSPIFGVDPVDPGTINTVVPAFLKENIGVPYINTPEGPRYVTLGNLVPPSQVNGLLEVFAKGVSGFLGRPGGEKSAPFRYLASQGHPAVKAALESILNTDMYSGRNIENIPGEKVEMFGVPMPTILARAMKNVRTLNELDRLNLVDFGRMVAGVDAVERKGAPFLDRLLTGAFGVIPTRSYGVTVHDSSRHVRFEQERKLQDDVTMLRRRLTETNKPVSQENADLLKDMIKSDLAAIVRRQETEKEYDAPADFRRGKRKPLDLRKYMRKG